MADIEIKAPGLELDIETPDEVEIEVEVEEIPDSVIETLLKFADMDNIATEIDEDTLKKLGRQVVEDFERDSASMADWSSLVEFGQDLTKQETAAKSEPWEGASNFKSPAILEAAVAFGDRATTELLRERNLVKGDVIGNDKSGEKKERVERVTEFTNWQLNHDMPGWRDKQSRLMYEVPASGVVFKKTTFDQLTGKNRSQLIQYPNFVVNQATTELDEATFTHVIDRSVNEILERQRAGLWLDIDLFGEKAPADEGSNAQQEVDEAFDNDQKFLEQNCFFDLDGDGLTEPYCVTVHEGKKTVMRIVARYDETSMFVKGGDRAVRPLIKGEDGEDLELVRIQPTTEITKYGFVPDPNGGYLDLGYYHILSSLVRAVNATTNLLIDSGTLANLQGGWLARGMRKKMGDMRVKPGQFNETDIAANDLQNGVLPYQFKEPSNGLFTLNEATKKEIDELTVNMDLDGVIAPNAPATTTLALIQEAMLSTSARLQSIVNSESAEFSIIHRLNSLFVDPEQYKRILDDEEADFEADFDMVDQNMVPTANPEMSSRMQRMNQANAIVTQVLPLVAQRPDADLQEPIDNFLRAIGAEDMVGKIFPTEEEQSEEQKARIQAQQEQAKRAEALQQLQIAQAERDLQVREDVAEAKIIRDNASALKDLAEIGRLKADTILKLEQAESEQLKNRIDLYTAELDQLDRSTKAIKEQLKERINDARQVSGEPGPGNGGVGNNAGASPKLALAPGNQGAI